ncbi:hypothetical protein BDR05DRAFT_69709 [Suillus weaverae]|nr:hypothetical protein BDR05DRAFT_69709 [Suillus weaverae]
MQIIESFTHTKLQFLRVVLGNPTHLSISFSALAFSNLHVAHDPVDMKQTSSLFNALSLPNSRVLEARYVESNIRTLFNTLPSSIYINFKLAMYNFGLARS